jgi:hypothetical protein
MSLEREMFFRRTFHNSVLKLVFSILTCLAAQQDYETKKSLNNFTTRKAAQDFTEPYSGSTAYGHLSRNGEILFLAM